MRRLTVLLVLVFLLAGCGKNAFESEVETEQVAVKLARDTAQAGYGLITAAELKAMLDEKKPVLLVDAMPYEDSYKKQHVPGAVQFTFPVEDMPEWDDAENAKTDKKGPEDYVKLLGEDRSKLIVTYCGFTKCGRSHNAAVWAKKLGYTNVTRFPGGIFAWMGAGYPVEGE